jgi:hypothetical protein
MIRGEEASYPNLDNRLISISINLLKENFICQINLFKTSNNNK